MGDGKIRTLWSALAGSDAKLAYEARWLLWGAPKQTLALLHEELHPASRITANQVNTWIAHLDGSSFKDRELALRELEKTGYAFEPLLLKALEGNPTLELRQRVEILLNKLAAPPTGETLRTLRAIAILEGIGGGEALAILRELADGAPGARVTDAAKAALKRSR